MIFSLIAYDKHKIRIFVMKINFSPGLPHKDNTNVYYIRSIATHKIYRLQEVTEETKRISMLKLGSHYIILMKYYSADKLSIDLFTFLFFFFFFLFF